MRARRSVLRITALACVVAASLAATGRINVRQGDTLSALAQRHGVSVGALVKANGIADPDRIYVGQMLVIPGAAPTRPAAGGAGAHVVRPGETLGSIARRHGLSIQAIARANGIVDVNRIMAGARLRLSAAAPAAVPKAAAAAGTHRVRTGETLGSIAARYGTTVTALARTNGISNPNLIRVGASLRVPGAGWQCPVAGASYVNDWGLGRPGGRWHEGNDLLAARGTPVRAPVSGRVEHYRGSIGGLQFKLFGSDGALYIGTHLDRFGASGAVRAGAVVGYVGTSGNARGGRPHLHFEIHPRHGAAVNPYPILRQFC